MWLRDEDRMDEPLILDLPAGAEPIVRPAQIAYLSPDLPDLLIIKQIPETQREEDA